MANYPDKKGYLLKYDARFNKIYEKELSPVGGPYDDYIFGQVFVGEDENVYITLWCKKNIGYDVLTIEVQKISSNGELVWARILHETITGFSHGIWYYVRNIREVSGKVFVGIQKFNQTYSGGWIDSEQSFIFALDGGTGSILWQFSLPEIVQIYQWPWICFDFDVSNNRIFTLYNRVYSEGEIGEIIVQDFSGNVLSTYSLNLPISPAYIRTLRATRDGKVYLLGSEGWYTYVMGLGKLG